MTVSQERFHNAFIVEVLRKHLGRHGVPVDEAANIMGMESHRLRAILDGRTHMRIPELLNLVTDERFHSLLADLVLPCGYVVRRPIPLNNPCPRVLNTKGAKANAVTAAAAEDGVIDHLEMPDVANANQQYVNYWDSFRVSR